MNPFISLAPICTSHYERVSNNMSCANMSSIISMVADVNADDQLDLIFYCTADRSLNILLGNSDNGKFEERSKYLFNNNVLVSQILFDDMNNDNQLDLVFVYKIANNSQYYFAIFSGNNDGTLQTRNAQAMLINRIPEYTLIVDIDNDQNLDIISANTDDNLEIFFGNGNGAFLSLITLRTGDDSRRGGLIVSDFNNDNYRDIAVFNKDDLHIHVFLASTNRSLWLRKWLFTSLRPLGSTIASGDFDGNNQAEIFFVNIYYDLLSIRYQYNDGTFHMNEQSVNDTQTLGSIEAAAVGDLNGDNLLDIVINVVDAYPSDLHGTYVLFGIGDGKYKPQQIFTSRYWYGGPWIKTIDFNHDNCQDIITTEVTSGTLDIFLNTCDCYTH